MTFNSWTAAAILVGVGAAVAFVLSAGVYWGYITAATVDNLSYGTLGVLGVVGVVAAIGLDAIARKESRSG